MEATDTPFTRIMNGDSQFVVPVFQRDYNWTEMHCEQLWRDIISAASASPKRGHFLGSLVYISTGGSHAHFTRWLLIDGQQRLTTLTLLLIALRDHISAIDWSGSGDDSPTVGKIEDSFLKNRHYSGDRQRKLILRGHDHDTLTALIDNSDVPEHQSDRILENYNFFLRQIKDVDPEAVYLGIGRLIVVDVTLTLNVDDPQQIFESLNSTGLDLSQSDLIRNFILMGLPEEDQTHIYESYWRPIENLFRDSERIFDSFIRDYIALQTQANKQERSDQIYSAFRARFPKNEYSEEKLEELLNELSRYAGYYGAFFGRGSSASGDLSASLGRLRNLADVPAILILRLFDCYERLRTLSLSEFLNAITMLESYILRRAICGMQTRDYWRVFSKLAYGILEDRPLESLKVSIARLPENQTIPSDKVFRETLESDDIYHKRVCFYLLDRLENCNNKEPTDTSKYSIEHILPQNENLGGEWRRMLGENWQEIQREWIHKLGNLTLTGYNSTYSDRSFEDKKGMEGGFSESSVRLNRSVRESGVWTGKEIQERGQELARRALDVWPMVEVSGELIAAARQRELRERARQRDVSQVQMTAAAQECFGMVSKAIQNVDSEVIELAERRSVSYHGPEFFLEVVPRIDYVVLLLALDFNEVHEGMEDFASDTSQWKFIMHAAYDAGVYVEVRSEADIERAVPLIRRAYELART